MRARTTGVSALFVSSLVLGLGHGVSVQADSHGTDCDVANFPDAEFASALDAYEVRWEAFRMTVGEITTVPGSRTAWHRVFDATRDGVDSLRSARLGANEEVHLIAHVRGPARVSFWWRVQPGTGDFARFRIKKMEEEERYIEEGKPLNEAFDWVRHEVDLEESAHYKLIWIYAEDGDTNEPNVGPQGDGLWIDQVEVDAEHYRSIPFDVVQGDGFPNATGGAQPSEYYALTLPTLHGRIYRLEYQSTTDGPDETSEWNKAQPHKIGDGKPVTFHEWVENYKVRRYRVRILQPPTFTSAPQERDVQRVEGEHFRLDYSAQGAAEAAHALQWTWERWPLVGDRPPTMLQNASPTLEIESVRPEDSGEYQVRVRNEAGCEAAPRVRLEVFRKPSIQTVRWQIGEATPVEETLSSGAAGGGPLEDRPQLSVDVRPGDRLRLEVEVAAETPITVVWQRWDRRSGRWIPSEGSDKTIVIDAMNGEKAGSYRAVARGRPRGEDISPPIAIELLEEPTVMWVLERKEIEVLANDIVTLSVRPAGSEPFTYAWFDDQKHMTSVRHNSYRPGTSSVGPRTIEAQVTNDTGVAHPTRKIRFLVKSLDQREIPDLGIRLLPVPAGTFRMGAPPDPEFPEIDNESPMRSVTLTHSYWMADTELTERQWSIVMGRPLTSTLASNLPASVTFEEAEALVATLTERERAAGRIDSAMRYAIPTEAQWERVARREASNRAEAQRLAASDALRPFKVKSGPVSKNGFYELFGNAWEWTSDRYVSNHDASATQNPTGPDEGRMRVLRGGGVDVQPSALSPTIRYGAEVDERSHSAAFGLRIVLERTQTPIEYVLGETPRQEGNAPEETDVPQEAGQ